MSGKNKSALKFLIYGTNVESQILACKLSEQGIAVTICESGKKAKWISDCGITLINANSGWTETAYVEVLDDAGDLDQYDFVVVAVERLRVDSLLSDLVSVQNTNIVFMINTAMGFYDVEKLLGIDRMMFCSISAGGYETDEGINYLMGNYAQKMFRPTVAGEFSDKKTERVKMLLELLRGCGFDAAFARNADAWLKTHAVISSSAANALFCCNGDNYELAAKPDLISCMIDSVREGFAVLKKYGIQPEPAFMTWTKLPRAVLKKICSVFLNTQCAEYTLARHYSGCLREMYLLQCEFDAFIDYSKSSCPNISRLRKGLFEYLQEEKSVRVLTR